MSQQQPESSPNFQTCDETEAWCNMISCIYNFLTSSTNLAAILEANYITSIQEPQVKQQLCLLPPPNPEEFHLSDFPWFLDILLGNHATTINAYYMTEEINPTVFSYSSQHDSIAEPNRLFPNTIGDCNELARTLESMYLMEQNFLQSYFQVQDSYETRFVLSSQPPSNYNIQYEQGSAVESEPNQELDNDNTQSPINQEPEVTPASQQDGIIGLKEPVELVGSISHKLPIRPNGSPSIDVSSRPDEDCNSREDKDNASEETIDEYTESDAMDLPGSKYESLVEIPNEDNKTKTHLEEQISAINHQNNDLLKTFSDINDMKSEEIQTVVNKRYNCTLKALITRSAEQQMPWEEVMPKSLEIHRRSLENNEAEDEPLLINHIEEPVEVREQQEHEAACSNLITKESNTNTVKAPGKDLKVNIDAINKTRKTVQGRLSQKQGKVKLVNVQLNMDNKESNENLKQLSKNTGPKLKKRNPILMKKPVTPAVKDTKATTLPVKNASPSASKNVSQKPTETQQTVKVTEYKRVIPKRYASVESAVKRFIQDGTKPALKPRDKPINRKPVHPNEVKALQNTLERAKAKAQLALAQKNSRRPVSFPKQVLAQEVPKVPISAPPSGPQANLKSRSIVVSRTSKTQPRNTLKLPESQYVQNVPKPGLSLNASMRTLRRSPVGNSANLKATSEVMSRLKSKTETVIQSKTQKKDVKGQEITGVKRVVSSKIQPAARK
ncbi:unnamed protein product [Acanthoscelides obtectus]|uniref:Uncharacterized protein n=1 Tax=Acanthoscelides obtectus TaxID=200917 RepID=A0A9P0Q7L9_ACAOB|nr:unnamed protein product [Acanthoscelides obtectus]CAK1670815.1 hypothetical protein AOBTE_LOCUS27849 [Acanthoscelides obtectus]